MAGNRALERGAARRQGSGGRAGPNRAGLAPIEARCWITTAACLLMAVTGLVSLVACGGTPTAAAPGPGVAEGRQSSGPQPTETGTPAQDFPAGAGLAGGRRERDYWPTEHWRTSSPEEQAMDAARLAEMMALIDEQDIAIDSVLVVRHGYLVLEAYRNGYGQNTRHHLQSVTKSFTSMLIGIAIQNGLIRGVEQTMVDFFPEHTIQNLDARKERLTLENLLTMTDGLDWHEVDYPYDDPRNTLGQMWRSRDAVQHVLDRPMVRDPGQRWAYNSGTSILLGGILEQVTKRDVLAFARDHLFDPIGIGEVDWSQTTGGHYHTDGGLWMTPRDMARFGYLMLNEGTWDGQTIVSPAWVERSATAHYQTTSGYGYGYQWWILPGVEAYAATGHYEQKIYVVPRADLIVVFTADIADEDPHPTDGFLERFIVPACTDLPEVQPVAIYDKYGFRLEHPLGARLQEAPIPGRDTVSDASGMVQFNTLYPPLELVNIIWDQAGDGVDVRQHLEDSMASVAEETGIVYDWGGSAEARKGDHELVLRFFHTTAEGLPFSGVVGIWHCEQADRIYLMTYAVNPEAGVEAVQAAFEQHLASLACHEAD